MNRYASYAVSEVCNSTLLSSLMKRSAPTPVQTITQDEAPSLSFGVIRAALIGMSFMVLLLIGLFCFFRARRPVAPVVAPHTAHASLLRMAATSAVAPRSVDQ